MLVFRSPFTLRRTLLLILAGTILSQAPTATGVRAESATPSPEDGFSRSSWIRELDHAKQRVKTRYGYDLDVDLAKQLCRQGALSSCEQAVLDIQGKINDLGAAKVSTPHPPEHSTNSVVIVQSQPPRSWPGGYFRPTALPPISWPPAQPHRNPPGIIMTPIPPADPYQPPMPPAPTTAGGLIIINP
jgi:hypothetical protein